MTYQDKLDERRERLEAQAATMMPMDQVRRHRIGRTKFLPATVLNSAPPLYQTEHTKDAVVVAKWFNPMGRGTWFMTELDPVEGRAFGYVVSNLGSDCDEYGYFMLGELAALRLRFGMRIERDIHWRPVPMSKAIAS